MTTFTDRLYRQWLVKNGRAVPRTRHIGGMGVVTPMLAQREPSSPSSRVQPFTPAHVVAAHLEKPDVAVEHQLAQSTLKSC